MALDVETIKASYLKLPDYQKALISLGIVLILGGVYFYYLYMPLQEKLKVDQGKLNGLKKELKDLRGIAAQLPQFEEDFKKLKVKYDESLKQLPSSDEIPKLIRDMESLGNEAKIKFNSVNMGGDIGKGFYAEVPVSLDMKGSYHDVAVFFDKLSKLDRIINISNLTLGSPKNESGRVILSIKCRATTFKYIK